MDRIAWEGRFSVGVEEIDRQHKQLVEMLNRLIDLDGITVASEKISDTLTRMTEYADYHFTSEEKFMLAGGYPGYETHRLEHVAFMRKTAELALGTMAYQKAIPHELVTFLKDWLVNHILESDMQYKSFLEAKGSSNK